MDRTQSDYSIYRQVVSQLMEGQEQLPSLPSITLEIRSALPARCGRMMSACLGLHA